MGTSKYSMTFDLSYENIDRFSEQLDAFQGMAGVTRRNCLRVRLLMEDMLVNLRNHYGEQQEVTAFFEKHLLRGARVRLEVKADRYNPLSATVDDPEDWARSLFTSSDLRPQYTYNVDKNYLLLKLPLTPMNPLLKMAIALALGIVLGLLGNVAAFDPLCDTLSQVILNPLFNAWIRVLVAISGPVIFFTATTTTLNTKHITDQGGSAFTLVARYFILMALTLLVAAPFCRLVFPLDIERTNLSAELAEGMLRSPLDER